MTSIDRRLPFIALESQLKAYKKRKKRLLKRMKLGTFLMCIFMIVLAWLQHWIPMKSREIRETGMS